MTAVAAAERGWLTIGEVLSLLARDFPEVSISKIRFLEAEGLIAPQRAKSGYRRFTDDDVSQLRLVLVAQRDRYLPLRVIKQHLAAGTLHDTVYPPEPAVEVAVVPAPSADTSERSVAIDPDARLLRSELETAGGLDAEQVAGLITASVICPDAAGRFTGADALICRAYAALLPFGVTERHLRQAKNTASRESLLISQATGHLAGTARQDAVTRMLGALSDAHYWLVRADLERQSPGSASRPRG